MTDKETPTKTDLILKTIESLRESLTSQSKEGKTMADESAVTNKDLLIHDLQEAKERWNEAEKSLGVSIAALQKKIEDKSAEIQKEREAETLDWVEHLKGKCSDPANCRKSKLVSEVYQKGRQSISEMSADEINELWHKPHKYIPPIREIVISRGKK